MEFATVRYQLETAVRQLEADAKASRSNVFSLRGVGNAAKLLRELDLSDRVQSILAALSDSTLSSNTITNLSQPERMADSFRRLGSERELELQHPPYCEQTLRERIVGYAKTEKHFAQCLAGRFAEARTIANKDLQLEEVGDTLAVLGEFDAAREIIADPKLEPFRQAGVRWVMMIELFRRGRREEADELLSEYEQRGLDPGARAHLALAFGGREPWGGYPYPDW